MTAVAPAATMTTTIGRLVVLPRHFAADDDGVGHLALVFSSTPSHRHILLSQLTRPAIDF